MLFPHFEPENFALEQHSTLPPQLSQGRYPAWGYRSACFTRLAAVLQGS
jgi:hypothetical protein